MSEGHRDRLLQISIELVIFIERFLDVANFAKIEVFFISTNKTMVAIGGWSTELISLAPLGGKMLGF